ncbi:Amidohydrolase 2 [Niveomyces insectorum RCEF 264]|uniref:Amidohydrolase 2 n=1 Tax=Niveomyces insectorum RCEF 264 TaxID=1081102 RepID=A0A167QFJ4_9HYPO|nr:Amidohydrolase 2 [Niveomyces insectorum RCEF 264]
MASKSVTEVDPKSLFPNGGWDTHHHIFDPERFPYSPNRHLTPPPATIEAFKAFQARLGLTKSVLTQGLSYGSDAASLKAFLAGLGDSTPSSIGVIDPESITDDELRALHAAGVRGLRVNLYRYGAMEDVDLQKKALLAHLKRVTDLSLPWSLTMTTTQTGFWDVLEPFIREQVAQAGRPLITDHFALLKAPSMLAPEHQQDPTKQPGFAAIMRLVRDGLLFVKLSAPYRVSKQSPRYEDARVLVRAFFDANNKQLLWGSDWPHTPLMKVRSREEALKEQPFLDIDDAAWLQSLRSWLSDEEWNLLMVENPSKLFAP